MTQPMTSAQPNWKNQGEAMPVAQPRQIANRCVPDRTPVGLGVFLQDRRDILADLIQRILDAHLPIDHEVPRRARRLRYLRSSGLIEDVMAREGIERLL